MHGGLAIGQQALIETGIAGQSAIDLDHRFTPARQQALAQHGQIHGQQEHDQVGITLAGVLQVPARAIDQHVLPCRQPVVDVARNAIGQAVSVPAQGKGAPGLHFGELLHADTQRRFPHRFRRASDDPPHDSAATFGKPCSCGLQQAVLA